MGDTSPRRAIAPADPAPDAPGRAPGAPLGRRVAELRSQRGWTQQDLAARLAVSRVAVSHLEAGLTDPGERTVALLAGVFHMEPHELVAGTNYPLAKAERLPLVVARYTAVEHELELLDRDIAWLDRTDGRFAADVLGEWVKRLAELSEHVHDPRERGELAAARRSLSDRRARRG